MLKRAKVSFTLSGQYQILEAFPSIFHQPGICMASKSDHILHLGAWLSNEADPESTAENMLQARSMEKNCKSICYSQGCKIKTRQAFVLLQEGGAHHTKANSSSVFQKINLYEQKNCHKQLSFSARPRKFTFTWQEWRWRNVLEWNKTRHLM